MERPKVEDYDLKPYGYIHDLNIYADDLIKRNEELLEALESMVIQVEDDLSSGFVDTYFAEERIKKAKTAINNNKS